LTSERWGLFIRAIGVIRGAFVLELRHELPPQDSSLKPSGGLYSSLCNIWNDMSFSGRYYSKSVQKGSVFCKLEFTDYDSGGKMKEENRFARNVAATCPAQDRDPRLLSLFSRHFRSNCLRTGAGPEGFYCRFRFLLNAAA
jgi:hypothetical protein